MLRPFYPFDAPAIFLNWTADPLVARFSTWTPHRDCDQTRQVVERWIAAYSSPTYYHWAVVLRATGTVIGSIALERCEVPHRMEAGYSLGRAWWGKGYGSEALGEVLRFAFEELGISVVQALHFPENTASGKVMRRCGMVYAGDRLRFIERDGRERLCKMYLKRA